MTKRVETTYQIPSWFQLEKYSQTEQFDIDDWIKELRYRHEIVNTQDKDIAYEKFKVIEKYGLLTAIDDEKDLALDRNIKGVGQHHVVSDHRKYGENGLESSCVQFDLEPLVFTTYPSGATVTTQSFSPFSRLENRYLKPMRFGSFFDRFENEEELIQQYEDSLGRNDIVDAVKKPSKTRPLFHFVIDPYAKDDILHAELDLILTVLRHSLVDKPSKHVSDTNVRKLHQYQVLPYIDLTISAKLNGGSIDEEDYILALFPRKYRKKPFIQESLEPLALGALELQFINSLFSLKEKKQKKIVRKK